ncbi:hypothetical protein JCM6882_005805 [Rhodosporidiobolus microsporus]
MALPDDKHRLSFPGVEGLYGWVTVDGQPLEVYGATGKDNKASGFIEAQDGKEFRVSVCDQRWAKEVQDAYGVRLYSSIRPLVFNSVRLTDDDDEACQDELAIKNLATIRLDFCRVKNVREVQSSRWHDTAFAAPKPIHEQAKKAAAISHQAGYGASLPARSCNKLTYDLIDPRDKPFASVEFKYLSRRLLQLEGHIPASPSPQPSPEPHHSSSPASPEAGPSQPRRSGSGDTIVLSLSPVNRAADLPKAEADLDVDEREERIAALQRQIDELRSGGSSQRRASEESTSPSRKRIKLEEVEKIEREKEEDRKKGKKPEVIDLCDSD